MKEQKVAIIITTYSQEKLLEKGISSIKKNAGYRNYKIYLVDDASEINIGNKMKRKFPFINVLINRKNLGFSKSNNLAIKKASKDYNPNFFLIFNDDCEIIQKNFIKNILKKTEEFQKTGIFGCKIIYPDKSMQWGVKRKKTYFFAKSGSKEKNKEFSKINSSKEVIGAFMLIRKKVFEEVGLFDEDFSPFYGEESDLCFRTINKGWQITYLGDFEVIHHRNKSINKFSKEEVWFIKKKNSIRLERKHYSFFKKYYYLLIHIGSLIKKEEIPFSKKLKMLLKAYLVNSETKSSLQTHKHHRL